MDTWTDGKNTDQPTIWLKDLLPHKLPNACVMAYGYNADAPYSTSIGGVRDNARKLLELLKDKREENVSLDFRSFFSAVSHFQEPNGVQKDPHRPIVFLGHSLGGIIIKQVGPYSRFWSRCDDLADRRSQALRIANNEGQRFSDIAASTKGIV